MSERSTRSEVASETRRMAVPRPDDDIGSELHRLLTLRRTFLPFLILTAAAVAGMPVPFLSAVALREVVLVVNVIVWSASLLALQADIKAERAKQRKEERMQ